MDAKTYIEQEYRVNRVRNDSFIVHSYNDCEETNKFWAYKHEITNYTRLIQQLEGDDLTMEETVHALKHIYRQLLKMTNCPVEIVNNDFQRCVKNMKQRLTHFGFTVK